MREIKFRAWDKQKNILGMVIELSYSPIIHLRYVPSYVRVQNFKYLGEVIHYSNPDEIKNDLNIEEFTGLNDRNGVEIYENDIIQYGSDEDSRFIVIFKYGCFYAHNILGNEFMLDCLLGSLLMSKKVCVIGNIHESSDLLGEEKPVLQPIVSKKNNNQPKTLDELIAGYKDDGCHETELDWGESKGEEL